MISFRWQQLSEEYVGLREWWAIAALGGALVVLGILIAAFPAILVALVSGCVLTAGIYLLSLGFAMRPQQVGSATSRHSAAPRHSAGASYGGTARPRPRVEVRVPRADERFSRSFRW